MSEMITKNHALVAQFGDTLDRLMDGIENFVANSRPTLGGERFLTDREVSARLKVSRRTLQDYRNTGIIAYYQFPWELDSHIILQDQPLTYLRPKQSQQTNFDFHIGIPRSTDDKGINHIPKHLLDKACSLIKRSCGKCG